VELAERYACARTTVNRALRELAQEGVLERRRKAGTRVRSAPTRQARFQIPLVRREIEATGCAYDYALLRREETVAPDWLREALALGADAPALRLLCLHSADGAPYQLEERWISLSALPQARAADFRETGPNEWLVAAAPFTEAEISFTAVAADRAMAAHLGCAPGAALFRAERTTWLDGAPLTHARLTFRPGHRITTRH
jgi:GntR family histidine utilization transcriptional repressor